LGYAVVTSVHGREAFGIAREPRPDLIISDWMTPEMDGVALFHALRGAPETAKIPIILMTAARPALHCGSGYSIKPFALPQFFAW